MFWILFAVLFAGFQAGSTQFAQSFSASYQSSINEAYRYQLAPHTARLENNAENQRRKAIGEEMTRFMLHHGNPVTLIHKFALEMNRTTTFKLEGLSDNCQSDLVAVLFAVIQLDNWALRFVDAMFKIPAGLLDGNLNWFGSFDECTNIAVDTPDFATIGTYCLVPVDGALKLGTCVPSSCGAKDVSAIVAAINNFVHDKRIYNLTSLNITAPADKIRCNNPNIPFIEAPPEPANIYLYTALAVAGVLVVLNVLSTGYDIVVRVKAYNEYNVLQQGPSVLDISASSNMFLAGNANATSTSVHHNLITDADEAPLVSDIDRPPTFQQQSIMNPPQFAAPKSGDNYRKNSRLNEFLLSFSILRNTAKLFNVDPPQSRGLSTLQALHGIRLLTMFWVILSHSLVLAANSGIDNAFAMLDLFKNIEFQVILHGFYAVDTFLVLGGFLLGYLTLRQLDKLDLSPGHRVAKTMKFFGKMYIHRYIRLTPVYALAILVYLGIAPYFMFGPTWEQYPDPMCTRDQSWWKNLLYIHNLVDKDQGCMGWTWYLSVDFQLFIISPIPLLAFYWRPLAGWLVTIALVTGSAVSSGLLAAQYDFLGAPLSPVVRNHSDLNIDVDGFRTHFFGEYYIMPWCRAAPWAIGLALGCALHRLPPSFFNARLQSKSVRVVVGVLGWSLSTIIGLLLIYGMWPVYNGWYDLPDWVSQLYWAGSRIAWGLCICWVIFACIAGIFPGNFIRAAMSWKVFIPLSRLTYCAYLYHPIVMCVYFWTMRNPLHIYDMELTYLFLASIIFVFSSVYIIAAGVEIPLANIERLILDRRPHRD